MFQRLHGLCAHWYDVAVEHVACIEFENLRIRIAVGFEEG